MGRLKAKLRIEPNPHGDLLWMDLYRDGELVNSVAQRGTREQVEQQIDEINHPKPVVLQVPEPPGGGYWVDENGKPLDFIPTITLWDDIED